MGVLTLQRLAGIRPFSRWDQELLRAVASQVSAAIHNARQHSEIVRLYNLTDEALAGRVQQLQALLNAMTEGVVMVGRAGTAVLVNPTAAQWLGQHAPQMGQPLEPAVTAALLGFTEIELADRLHQLETGTMTSGYGRVHYPLPVEPHRLVERQETAVFDRDGQLIGWLLLLRDVTEEHELAEQREELARMIVHDLRNPLTTIATTMQMAQERVPASGDLTSLLQDAYAGSLDLLDMVDSLMDINRMEAGQSIVDAEAMRLPPLAQQVVNRLQPLLAHKQISLTLDSPADLPAIWADAELVRRVLVNLLDNALKFTPGHGRITITLQPEPAANGHEPGVRCIILDSGLGIPPEFREQAFDRYTRTNPGGAQVRGAGLGLTFCKMAIEAQHGRIWVEDAPGGAPQGGSQFVFTLPGIPVFS
jgi:signal transduction histidine kinase